MYVELSNDAVTCTVLCPYGNVITTSYDALSTVCLKPLKDHIQSGQILSYIQDNVSDFITDIYYRNRVRAFDPFSDALASVEGLKEYMIKTIYTYNKEMTRAQGLEFVKLTKTHLCRSAGYDYCEFETTPLYLLNKAATTIQEAARKDYEASNLAEQEVYKEAARELDEARSLANRVYSSAMASIQLSTAPETLHDHSLSPVKTVPAAAPLNKVGHLMLHGPREEPLKFQEIKSSLGSGSIQENAFSDDEDFDAEICAFMEHGIMDH